MPLTPSQVDCLRAAVSHYAFPPAHFDFASNAPVTGLTMDQVEARIRKDLLTEIGVKDGLSNILYWGFAQMRGLAEVRVSRFRLSVTEQQLVAASRLFSTTPRPALADIARLKLPQFSGVSFVSKVRMFLDPDMSATLDRQIMQIHGVRSTTVLAAVRQSPTTIPVTEGNSAAYEAWCTRLACIRDTYLPSRRVVDVERGFFQLIQSGRVQLAAHILADA
ncbi:hypothetical protein NYD60_11960 [Burkholderia thailandensis]|uniref:hypothetical protein n=1 Tax=Burkholderia thailandensis TaxID=57975 RepID=UPI00217DF7AF|nr:hypothetical protein [Burkholderia thailandensis]MCS6500730.1 hypothetical protein [Burkholderia thailandensis]